jgi:hypothetical protein
MGKYILPCQRATITPLANYLTNSPPTPPETFTFTTAKSYSPILVWIGMITVTGITTPIRQDLTVLTG